MSTYMKIADRIKFKLNALDFFKGKSLKTHTHKKTKT